MKKSIIFPISILLAIALFFSCHKEEDIPPSLTLDKEANMTIAELLSLYEINKSIS